MRRISGALIALLILSSSLLLPLSNIPFIDAQGQSSGIIVKKIKTTHDISPGETASYYYLRDEAKQFVNGVYDSSEIEYLGFDKNTYDFGFTISGDIVARATPVILVNVGGQWRLAVIRAGQITSSTFYSISGSDSQGDYLEIGYYGSGKFDLYTYPSLTYFASSSAVLNKIALKYHVDEGSFQWIANVTLSQSVSNTGALLAWRSLDNQALRYVMVNGTIYDLAQVSNIPPEIMRLPASFLSDSQSLTSITWDSSLLMDKGSGKISEITDLPNAYGRALLAGSYNWGSSDSIYIEDAISVTVQANQNIVVWNDGVRDHRFNFRTLETSSDPFLTRTEYSFDYDDDSAFDASGENLFRFGGTFDTFGQVMGFTNEWLLQANSDTFNETQLEDSEQNSSKFWRYRFELDLLDDDGLYDWYHVESIIMVMDGSPAIYLYYNITKTDDSLIDFNPRLRNLRHTGSNAITQNSSDATQFAQIMNFTMSGQDPGEFNELGIFSGNATDDQLDYATAGLEIMINSNNNAQRYFNGYTVMGRYVDQPTATYMNYAREFNASELIVDANIYITHADGLGIFLDATAEADQATDINWLANNFSSIHEMMFYLQTDETTLLASTVTINGITNTSNIEIIPWNDEGTTKRAIVFGMNSSTSAQTGNISWGIPTWYLTSLFHTGISSIDVNGTSTGNLTETAVNDTELALGVANAASGYSFLYWDNENVSHIHDITITKTMSQNTTITAYAIAVGGGGVSGVSMLVLAVVGGFGLIVVAVASRKR